MRHEKTQNAIDPLKQEETVQKIASIKAKKQEIINDVKLSLKQRQFDKIAIENVRSDIKMNMQQKKKDTEKLRGEKAMLQVIIYE